MHASKHLHCYKLFAIKKSIVYLVSHEFVCAINLISENCLKWPFREMNWLKSWTQFCQNQVLLIVAQMVYMEVVIGVSVDLKIVLGS